MASPFALWNDVRPWPCRLLADCLPIEVPAASTPAGLQELQLLVSDAVQLHEEEGKLLAAAIQMTLQSEAGTYPTVVVSGSSPTDTGSTVGACAHTHTHSQTCVRLCTAQAWLATLAYGTNTALDVDCQVLMILAAVLTPSLGPSA